MGSFLSPRAVSLACAVSLPHSLRGGAHFNLSPQIKMTLSHLLFL